jgi:putative ABC transport system permease protein
MIIPLALIRAHALQRPFRTLLSIAGVALGVLASVAIGTANIHVLRSFEQAVTTVAGSATLEIAGHDLGVDESVITAVRAVKGVVSAAPVIEESVVVTQGEPRGQALQILGLDLISEVRTRGFQIAQADTEGALEELLAPDALYLGRQVAADLNLGVGSIVEVTVGGRVVRLRVVGLIHHEEARSSLWDRLAVMDIAAAQLLFQSVGRLDRIDLVTTPARPLDDIVASLRAILPPHLLVQRPAQRTKQVENMVWAFQLNLSVMSWVGLLVGVFLTYNTIAFAVAQRRREIGIYRALGMTEQRVAGLFLAEAGDLSFISLRTVLDPLLALVRPGGDLVLLVKPQFEVGRAEASRGKGVIRDPDVRAGALAGVRDALTGRGAVIMGDMTSPLKGGAGNVEFLVHARAPESTP